MTFRAVTTCSADGWEKYGRRMAESFVRNWHGVGLTVYAEGFEPDVAGVEVQTLPAWLDDFKKRHANNRDAHGRVGVSYDFKRDCVRFSHKVAAIGAESVRASGEVLIWIDADTFTHSPVDEDWLNSLLPPEAYLAWLDRPGHYPECGFLMFRTAHPMHLVLMERLIALYRLGGVFSLPETHDSYVIQQVVEAAARKGEIPQPANLSGARTKGHVFLEVLGTRMDHMKGARKDAGRSPASERKTRDDVAYWRT